MGAWKKRLWAILGIVVIALSGCGSDTATVLASLTNSATARAAFERQGFTRALAGLTGERAVLTGAANEVPGYFGMKIVAIYITPDIDPDTGENINIGGGAAETQGIYAAPECFTEDGNGQVRESDGKEVHFGICDLETGATSSSVPPVTVTQAVTTYVDLAAADVNATLNADRLSIKPGTYKYVRISAAGAAGGKVAGGVEGTAKNLKIWHSQMGGTVADKNLEFRNLSSTDVPLGTGGAGITITAGQTVTIDLQYDLAGMLRISDTGDETEAATDLVNDLGGQDECGTLDGKAYCIKLPEFTPVVQVQ